MKKIFLIIMMIICCISVAACNKNNNNNNNNNNNADDEYKCNIQLNYSDSKFSEYTSFDKAKDNISDYDLYEIVVLYYYQEDKVVALDHTKYYITITDANDNIISGLTQDMAVGVYKITFTHFEFVDSKIIIFEVTESKENIPDDFDDKILLNFNDSNFSNYTTFIKDEDLITDYDLSKIKVLYYYEKDKFEVLDSEKVTITITDENKNIINKLSQDMDAGLYDITITYQEKNLSKTIKLEVIDEIIKPIVDGILNPDFIDPTKETVVTFYHAMGAANQAVIQDIIDKFETEMLAKYGVKVTVEQRSQGDYDTLRKTIAASIVVGEQPTIAQAYPDHVSLYLQGEAVRDLNKYIEHEEYGLEGDPNDSYGYIDKFWAEGSIYDKEGTIYSIPFNKSTEVLFYNKTLFDKYNWDVPETWDDVIEICEAWKETSEYQQAQNEGKKVGGIGIDSEANFFITIIQQYGGEFTGFDENGKGEYRFDSVESRAALEWLVDEFNNGNTVTATYLGTDYCSDAFNAMQLPMTLGSSAGAKYNVPYDGSFVTGIAPYPQMAGASEDEKFVIQQGTNITLFECPDKQEELFGWLFIKYLTNYESSLKWALNTGYFPIRKDVADSQEYEEYLNSGSYDYWGNPVDGYDPIKEAIKVGLKQVDYFYVTPTFPGSSRARSECEFVIQSILYNQKEYDVDRAIKEALEALEG